MAKSEEQIISELNVLRETYSGGAKVPSAKAIYLASPWFDDTQANLLIEAYKNLLQNPTIGHIHVPLLHQYQGQVLSSGETDHSDDFKYEWATKTFEADVTAMKNTDLTVALETSSDVDTGTSWEMGFTVASQKSVVALFSGDLDEHPVNLMESFSVSSYVTSPEELKKFNFLDIAPRKFEGKIIQVAICPMKNLKTI